MIQVNFTEGEVFRILDNCYGGVGRENFRFELITQEQLKSAILNKIVPMCQNAEKSNDGKCRGYQRGYWDDEPAERCKGCSESIFYEEDE